MKLYTLKSHPAQPPGRTRNTKGLQASIRAVGMQVPILLAADAETVLSGSRRVTALLALGFTETEKVIISDVDADTPEAIDLLLASNEQQEMTHCERLHVLQSYELHGLSLRKAAARVGISPTQASFLARLAKAPQEIRDAIEEFDRHRRGLSFSAWKEMANEPPDVQLQQLHSGRTKGSQVKGDRQGRVEEKATLLDDPSEIFAEIASARESLGEVLAYVSVGNTTGVVLRLAPVVNVLMSIKERCNES